jgi:predicted NodU family carbamoyl transferase
MSKKIEKPTKSILGLHHGHDATVVYIDNGEIVEAMSEERLSRQKKHIGFPRRSLAYVKEKYNIRTIDTLYVVGEKSCWDASIFLYRRGQQKNARK